MNQIKRLLHQGFTGFRQTTEILISFCNLPTPRNSGLLHYNLDHSSGQWIELGYQAGSILGNVGICRNKRFIFCLFNVFEQGATTYVSILDAHQLSPLLCQKLDEVVDPHSLCIDDNRITIASTGIDELIQYQFAPDGLYNPQVIWRASNTSADTHHLNSVIVVKNQILCSCFGPRQGEKWTTASEGYILNVSTNRVLKKGIYHPHSLIEHRGQVYYCESVHSALSSLDEKIASFDGYTRGLAFLNQDKAVIGASLGRRTSRSERLIYGLGNTVEGNIEGQCNIVVYDTRRQEIQTHDLSEYGTEVYDICPLNI